MFAVYWNSGPSGRYPMSARLAARLPSAASRAIQRMARRLVFGTKSSTSAPTSGTKTTSDRTGTPVIARSQASAPHQVDDQDEHHAGGHAQPVVLDAPGL